MNSPHKGPVPRKIFPFDDVIMTSINFNCMVFSLSKQLCLVEFVCVWYWYDMWWWSVHVNIKIPDIVWAYTYICIIWDRLVYKCIFMMFFVYYVSRMWIKFIQVVVYFGNKIPWRTFTLRIVYYPLHYLLTFPGTCRCLCDMGLLQYKDTILPV